MGTTDQRLYEIACSFLALEALLNLCNPQIHKRFNLGVALQTLDPDNMQALCKAIVRTYNRR